MSLTEMMTRYAQDFINSAGYFGAGTLMALESMIAPIPSEAVMPFIGMSVKNGKMDLTLAIAVTSAGSLVGSLISYWLGAVGGKPLVMSVVVHSFIADQPFRLRALSRALAHITSHSEAVWLARPGEIAGVIATSPELAV